MSNSSKSPNQAKRSSSVPPTARSPSLITAEPLTDPLGMPTALSNSVNTAIGQTASEFETRDAAFSDTSAGSGRITSNASTPVTAKAPTSPEVMMNDLKRGNLFGRQNQGRSEPSTLPPSYTNVTFSEYSTASQLSSFDPKPMDLNQNGMNSEISNSTKTGIPMSGKSVPRGRSVNSMTNQKSRKRSPVNVINALKKNEEKQKKLDEKNDFSKKSAKRSKKSQKSKKRVSRKSMKSKKGSKAPGDISFRSIKSKKSMKSKKNSEFGQSEIKKKENIQKKPMNSSVYLPGVMDNTPVPNQISKKPEKSTKSVRKFNEMPAYNFPGAGKCTRKMDQVAPPTTTVGQENCVYDVAKLPPTQRRFPSKCVGGRAPKSLFGSRPKSVVGGSIKETIVPTGNKIVVFGTTSDGKNTIQMTIDMKIVAGEALKGSDKPLEVIPKKILVGGKEYSLDSNESSRRSQ